LALQLEENPFSRRAGTAGALDFSRTAEANGNFPSFEDYGDLAPPVDQFQHAIKP
jgi:hypothetical protein